MDTRELNDVPNANEQVADGTLNVSEAIPFIALEPSGAVSTDEANWRS